MNVQRSLVVELERDGVRGYGEVTENSYYGHTLKSMTEAVDSCRMIVERDDFKTAAELWSQLYGQLSDDMFTLSAIDLAAHDLFGKLAQCPTYRMLGLQWSDIPESSYTIGIDSIDRMVAKIQEQPDWSIYKIKLGTSRDVEIVQALQNHTDAVFRVDANCGWTAQETIDNSRELARLGVETIDIYQLHRPDYLCDPGEVAGA